MTLLRKSASASTGHVLVSFFLLFFARISFASSDSVFLNPICKEPTTAAIGSEIGLCVNSTSKSLQPAVWEEALYLSESRMSPFLLRVNATAEEERFCESLGLQKRTVDFGECVLKFLGRVPKAGTEQINRQSDQLSSTPNKPRTTEMEERFCSAVGFAKGTTEFGECVLNFLGKERELTKSLEGLRQQSADPSPERTDGGTGGGTPSRRTSDRGTEKANQLKLVVSPSQPDANGVISLVIATNSDTASLKINGDEQGGRADGRYSVRRFVQVGENRFEVVATDRFGNTQRQIVSVNREVTQVAVRSQPLDPLRISASRPRDAVAIIIGIEKYRRVPAADFANRDASIFYDYSRRALGIQPENIQLLLDDKADAAEILRAFRAWLPTRVNKGKTDVYVFFSGHGLPAEDGKVMYFLPYGVDKDFLDRTAVTQKEVVDALQRTNPKSVTMFIDSCYSGQSRTGETLLASARPISIVAKETSSFPANFTVISASAPDQISSSSPELRHGIFSYYLMRGMEGEADGNKDGQITVAEMQAYLAERVPRRAMGMNRTQLPQVVGDQTRVLVGR